MSLCGEATPSSGRSATRRGVAYSCITHLALVAMRCLLGHVRRFHFDFRIRVDWLGPIRGVRLLGCWLRLVDDLRRRDDWRQRFNRYR